MQLKVLSYNDVEQARIWRNETLSMNRTPYPLTQEQQAKFYHEVVCNRQANSRYWGIWEANSLTENETYIGMGEITNISLENRNGEIGLLMNPGYVYMANEAIDLILEQAFEHLNLENIYGECYLCSGYIGIWISIALRYYEDSDALTFLPKRKYWQGQYYDSLYFNINKGDWAKCKT